MCVWGGVDNGSGVAFMSESAMMRSMLTEKDSSVVHLTDRSARNSKEKMNHRSMEALTSI